MPTLISTTLPFLRILVDPVNVRVRQFDHGRLDIETDDPDWPAVAAEAQRNPHIRIVTSLVTCPECGESFHGKAAHPELGQHRKAQHFEAWVADREAKMAQEHVAELTSRSGVPCDVCPPALHSVFPTAAALADHVKVMHTAAPRLTDSGETAEPVDRPGDA